MATTQTITAPVSGSVRRRVLLLALPTVGEQVLNTAVGLTDIYLVGHLSPAVAAELGYGSAVAQASTGLANQMIWLVTVLFIAFAIGSTALIARASGAQDREATQRIMQQSLWLGLGIGLLTTLFVFGTAHPFLLLLNAPATVLPQSLNYLYIIAPSLILSALLFVGNACLRGIGDTRTPLSVMLGANAVNILVSWLLVNGNLGMPALGVGGAAIGTAIGRGGGGLVVVALLLRGRSGLRLGLDFHIHMPTIRRILRVGLPSAGEMLVFQGALLVFVRFVTGLGTAAYAAHNVTISIESLSFLPGMGYAAAAATLVGQGLGARSPEHAADCAYEALWQGGLMMSLAGAVMVMWPEQLLAIFTNDPAVIALGVAPLRAAGLAQPALAASFILSGGLRGAGDTRWPLYIRLISAWGIRLPLVLLLVSGLGMGMAGIWLAMCTDFTVQGLLSLWRFNAGHWQDMKV